MTPIILLHHNEPTFLERCINSIEKNTKSKFKIIIVDNRSEEKIINGIIKKFSKKYKLILNKKDNWIFGFNLGTSISVYPFVAIITSLAFIDPVEVITS